MKNLPELHRGHVPPMELQRGAASLDTAQAGFLLHALTCGRCAGVLLAILRPRGGPEIPAPLPAIDFRPIWERASSRARPAPIPQFQELLKKGPKERQRQVQELAQIEPWVTPWALLEAARREPDAGLAETLARLAWEAVSAGAQDLVSRAQLGDLRALVLAEIAEACRPQGRLDESQDLLDQAAQALSPDLGEARVIFCRLLGRLRQAQGRPDDALALFQRSGTLAESLGRIELQAAALLDLGSLQMDLDRNAEAIQAFGAAALLGPRGLAPSALVRALEGLALGLTLGGELDQARHALAFARQQFAGPPASIESLDLMRLAGRLALEAGELEEAGDLLGQAFAGLRELAVHRAAVAGVELAWLALLRRDRSALAAVTADLLACHTALPARPRAVLGGFLAALAENDTPTVELARATAHQLDRMPGAALAVAKGRQEKPR
jgi:tetratricopeptide (TPR) repeat protein